MPNTSGPTVNPFQHIVLSYRAQIILSPKKINYQTTPKISTTDDTVSKKGISPDALFTSIVFRHCSDKKAVNTQSSRGVHSK